MRYFVLLLTASLLNCAAAPKTVELPTAQLQPGIYDVRTGNLVAKVELWQRLEAARFVIVAESHDSAADHAIQLEVLQSLGERGELALGMEMFQRPFQSALDQFVTGEIDEAQMLTRTQWEDRWGFAIELYQPLWQWAAEQQVPIVALNARRELTKRIAAVGVEGLTEQERADLPELDLDSPRYRAWMRGVFRAHGAEMEADKFDRFFQAQLTWDETMADTAVRWEQANPGTTMVIVVGRGHVERDFGIPSRIRRRTGAEYGDGEVISIVPLDGAEVPRFRWMRRERFADFVWVR